MSEDFYCKVVLSGRIPVQTLLETDNVLSYHHTRPFYLMHIVTIPKKHIPSLISLEYDDNDLLIELYVN
jgi:histidine triad (HIT) family protein